MTVAKWRCMSIQQLSATYSPDEDRLMFRFNTAQGDEYRVWLTRFLCAQLLGNAQEGVVQILSEKFGGTAAQTIAGFRNEAAERTTDFKVPFSEPKNLPLGDKPVLVRKIKMEREGPLRMKFILVDGRVVTINLNEAMLRSMSLLLKRLVKQANWGLETDEPAPAEQSSATGVLH